MVMDWKTVSIDHRKVSKLFIDRLGLAIPFTHTTPYLHTLPVMHNSPVNSPVSKLIQLFFSTPLNNSIPAIENIAITNNNIYIESITILNETNSVWMIRLSALIRVIVFNGRRTLIARRALTEKPMLRTSGRSDVTTITKSSIFHKSLKYAFLLNTNPNAIIFTPISTVYIAVNALSIVLLLDVLSGLSRAILIELRMMIIMIKA